MADQANRAEQATAALRDHVRSRLLTTEQLRNIPAPTWIIDDILPRPGVAMVFGPVGAHKTRLVIGWALCMATGVAWEAAGVYAVEQGLVLYVAAEGAHGIGQRVAAWEMYNSAEADNVLWYPAAINLLQNNEVDAFIDVAGEHRPAVLILDTFARCTVGGDENSAKDVGIAVDNLGRISARLGATVVVVHHSRKDGSDYRGSSALLGAVDTAIEVTPSGSAVTVSCVKQKDAAPFDDIELQPHEIAGSCVLRHVAHNGTGLDRADDLLALLCQMGATEAVPTGLLRKTAETDLKVPTRSFYRLMEGLVRKGFVLNIGTEKRAVFKASTLGHATVRAMGATPVPDPPGTGGDVCHATTTSLEVAHGTHRGANNGAAQSEDDLDALL